MKKIVLVLVLLFTGMAVFAQTGVIRQINGTVELRAPGDSDFVAANIGDILSQDTVISTGFRSNALIEIGSVVIAVQPLTRLTLVQITALDMEETLNINMHSGRVRVDINAPAGGRASMNVSSPTATASVRGTSFWFDGRNLSVGYGSVSFSGNRGHEIRVNAGSISSVTRDNRASRAAYTGVTWAGGGYEGLVILSDMGGDPLLTVVTAVVDAPSGTAPIGNVLDSAVLGPDLGIAVTY